MQFLGLRIISNKKLLTW